MIRFRNVPLTFCLLASPFVSVEGKTLSKGCFNKEIDSPFSDNGALDTFKFTVYNDDTQNRRHQITYPENYDPSTPAPLLMHFHGYGNPGECGHRCSQEAPEKGFITLEMVGYGPPGYQSWKFSGSTYEGDTCSEDTPPSCYLYGEKQGCDCSQANQCLWTTCFDSVAQVVEVMNIIEENVCVDLDNVWASGCSNGGIFTYELAKDERTAFRLKGIIPMVGLPNYGYSVGPNVNMKFFGMWGVQDPTVPPLPADRRENPDKTIQDECPGGWYYTAWKTVMADWTAANGCSGDGKEPLTDEYKVDKYLADGRLLKCLQGCSESKEDKHVAGCLFRGKHWCEGNFIWQPVFEFMLSYMD